MSGPLFMKPAVLQGSLDLTAAATSSYHDNQATWPQKLRLDRFVYDAIDGASAKERLEWLRRNETGYSPQIYDQLAAVYRAAGHDDDARRILIASSAAVSPNVIPRGRCGDTCSIGRWGMATARGWPWCGWLGCWSSAPSSSDMLSGATWPQPARQLSHHPSSPSSTPSTSSSPSPVSTSATAG